MIDALIAGGGLSGLSLAAHLAAGPWRDRDVLVVDDPSAPAAACWASWSASVGLLDAAVSRTFDRVLVQAAGRSRLLPLGRYRYRVVRREDLRRVVADVVAGAPGYELRTGRVQRAGDEVTVDGHTVAARWVFDSVTPPPPGPPPDARLAFTGWEVRCGQTAFDPEVPVLLDFRAAPGRARFGYVLPADARRALVELTEFVPRRAEPPTAAQRAAALREYLGGVDYTVVREESAVLPLRTRPVARASGRVLAIGAPGGLIKASTGYAYGRIQRDSAAIAASLARHGHPFDLPAPRARHRLLDAVLLRVLDRNPAQLERAFARLFGANPAERVLRFLDEETTVLDELRLIASLPPAPFLRAVVARTS